MSLFLLPISGRTKCEDKVYDQVLGVGAWLFSGTWRLALGIFLLRHRYGGQDATPLFFWKQTPFTLSREGAKMQKKNKININSLLPLCVFASLGLCVDVFVPPAHFGADKV
jgi:hypothetical protein